MDIKDFLDQIAPAEVCCGTCGSWTDFVDAEKGECPLCRIEVK